MCVCVKAALSYVLYVRASPSDILIRPLDPAHSPESVRYQNPTEKRNPLQPQISTAHFTRGRKLQLFVNRNVIMIHPIVAFYCISL